MLPPGCPPSASSTGSMDRDWYAGPPAAWIAVVSLPIVTSAATTPSSVAPVPPPPYTWLIATSVDAAAAGPLARAVTPAASRTDAVSAAIRSGTGRTGPY
jgi:hypothetical protein